MCDGKRAGWRLRSDFRERAESGKNQQAINFLHCRHELSDFKKNEERKKGKIKKGCGLRPSLFVVLFA